MNAQFYKEYYTLEREGWWFTARLKILKKAFSTFIQKRDNNEISILNAGAATGATSEMLSDFGQVTSLEYDTVCCEILFEKTGIKAINASLTDLPFETNSFDAVCAFDVVEHIEDDTKAIQEIKRVLKPGGHYFLTVPAYQFLWSNHDEVNHHFRRYTKSTFSKLLLNQGFKIDYSSYFNFWLFLPITLTRLILNLFSSTRKSKDSSGSDNDLVDSKSITNKILKSVFSSEKVFIDNKISLPFGVSFLAIGRK